MYSFRTNKTIIEWNRFRFHEQFQIRNSYDTNLYISYVITRWKYLNYKKRIKKKSLTQNHKKLRKIESYQPAHIYFITETLLYTKKKVLTKLRYTISSTFLLSQRRDNFSRKKKTTSKRPTSTHKPTPPGNRISKYISKSICTLKFGVEVNYSKLPEKKKKIKTK